MSYSLSDDHINHRFTALSSVIYSLARRVSTRARLGRTVLASHANQPVPIGVALWSWLHCNQPVSDRLGRAITGGNLSGTDTEVPLASGCVHSLARPPNRLIHLASVILSGALHCVFGFACTTCQSTDAFACNPIETVKLANI